MRPALEVATGVLLLAALLGLALVLVGVARGGLDSVPAIGIVLLVVAGVPVATRLADARRGLARMWGWLRRE